MTNPPPGPAAPEFDPGSMAASSFGLTRAVWYKRPWVLVTLAVALVIGVSVLSDLPHRITPAQDAGDQNAALRQINSDLKPCVYSLHEAFTFYRLELAHQMSAANFNLAVKTYLPQDQQSCSFVSSYLTDMTGNLQIVDTPAGKQIEQVRLAVVRWIDHDAQDAVKDITYLFTHPGDERSLHDLSVEQGFLNQDRLSALAHLVHAARVLGVTLVPLTLPVLARLPGT
ncbi:MAG: hypothetical protein ACHQFZ_09520 [Acidimicrobiales bacterium]